MTQGIGNKVNNFSIGAGYYKGDSFPGSSSSRADIRGFAIFDHADYRKPGVNSGLSASASISAGKNLQTADLSLGYGGKLYEQGDNTLTWNTSAYFRAEHTTNNDAKYVDSTRFDKQRTWCDETLVHNYNDTYGAAGIKAGLRYDTKKLSIGANAALEYGEHIGLGSALDCTNSPASAHGNMTQYAYNKAAEEGKRVDVSPKHLKGIFSANADYRVSKNFSVGTGVEFNTAKPKDIGVFGRVAYTF